jgi:large subunit ribosomal protein L24
MSAIKLKVGDTVMVRAGREKGKTGKITAVHPRLNKVTVDGINVVKKHKKPSQLDPQGGIMQLTQPIAVSKVGIVHPSDKTKTSRIGYKIDDKGNKTRVYRQAKNKEIS